MPTMMVALMQVRSLTWVTVRPASRRAFARVSPMVMARLHDRIAQSAPPDAERI
jgi:hypothetical protein